MRYRTIITLLALLSTLSACNTMEGMGQDLQEGGKKIEKSADENK